MKAAADGWTPERVASAKRLLAEGFSFSQIAGEIGGGLSRNAVIGKMRRLGVSVARAPKPKAAPRPHRKSSMPVTPTIHPFRREAGPDIRPVYFEAENPHRSPEPDADGVALLDLRPRQCRWPLWAHGAAPGLFCGEATASYEESYCPFHRAKAGGGFPQRRGRARRAPLMIAAE